MHKIYFKIEGPWDDFEFMILKRVMVIKILWITLLIKVYWLNVRNDW